MRVSIVTPSLNQGEFIEDCILSVMNQNHLDVEHLVIDGVSTDNTLSLLSKYPHLKWISERDSGQSSAINKGFRMASGEIWAWLNSDDFYEKNVFGEIIQYFRTHPDCMFLYGDITYVNRKGEFLFNLSGDAMGYEKLVRCPDVVRQPSCFWRRQVVEELGGVDESLHIVMDFDFFLRVARRYPFHYLSRNLSYFRTYAENKTSGLGIRQTSEIYKVLRKQKVRLHLHHVKYFSLKLMVALGIVDALRPVVRLVRKRKGRIEEKSSLH